MAEEARVVEIQKKLAELKSRCEYWHKAHSNGDVGTEDRRKLSRAENRIKTVNTLLGLGEEETILKLAEELTVEANELLFDFVASNQIKSDDLCFDFFYLFRFAKLNICQKKHPKFSKDFAIICRRSKLPAVKSLPKFPKYSNALVLLLLIPLQ